ncbi:beta-N-acetylhexosaminidase [Mesobacterium pallidum]|uniref:beta-N-acetylhexosaminidase n=1 Tax=Mesobacterium pallidum TaxID=2872037 RepID=UPI001EE2555F|nr:beta-N-acetylhexosaminidase [Mesobacterium pallidum]
MPSACIFDPEGLRLNASERALYRDLDPWGFILFARNIDSPDQVHALTSELREVVGRDAVITVDQEGGRVQRLRAPHWREWTPPLDFVRTAGENAVRAMEIRYRLIAAELRAVGIDSNCAPTADLLRPETHEFLQNRTYGKRVGIVTERAAAAARGMLEGGVLPVLKHIPGHGRATQDSHKSLPRVRAALEQLDRSDFAPFAALAELPMGMTAHIVFEEVDDRPATISPAMIRIIRERIGFDGLLMTDDLRMEALSGCPAGRAEAAIAAGCDLALYCNGSLGDKAQVATAAGAMTEAAMRRAKAALAMRRDPAALDIPALETELDALMAERVDG